MLDTSPRNELGKNILDPAVESKLLAAGVIYARRVFHADGKFHLRTATTPINIIAANVLKPPINSTLVSNYEQKRENHYLGA
jgi:hypothetical protein